MQLFGEYPHEYILSLARGESLELQYLYSVAFSILDSFF